MSLAFSKARKPLSFCYSVSSYESLVTLAAKARTTKLDSTQKTYDSKDARHFQNQYEFSIWNRTKPYVTRLNTQVIEAQNRPFNVFELPKNLEINAF